MTAERYIIIALSLTVAVLLAVLLWPTENTVMPIDPETYRIEERMRLRAVEVAPLQTRLDSLVKALEARPAIRAAKRTKIATERMSMSDSVHAELLHERLR